MSSYPWILPKTFRVANAIELFERAAFYGAFIAIALYLTRSVGLSDIQTGWVLAVFVALFYLLPVILGSFADRLGFKRVLLLAYIMLIAGYILLGRFPNKQMAVVSLILIVFGSSVSRLVISWSITKSSDQNTRAHAFSILHHMINLGAVIGVVAAKPIRVSYGLEYIFYFAAALSFIAFIIMFVSYEDYEIQIMGKSFWSLVGGFLRALTTFRFITFMLIVGCFWTIQGQIFATLPRYMIRLKGDAASPEWFVVLVPLVALIFKAFVSFVSRNIRTFKSIAIGLLLAPLAAYMIGFFPWTISNETLVTIVWGLSVHPLTIMIVAMILLGLGECFLSSRFILYASKQAPPREAESYMEFKHLTILIGWFAAFASSGYLLNAYCPDPAKLLPTQYAAAYAHASYIWYLYALIGAAGFVLLIIFRILTFWYDRYIFAYDIATQKRPQSVPDEASFVSDEQVPFDDE